MDRPLLYNNYYTRRNDNVKYRGCEKRIVPKKERPRVYNELKVFLSVIINLQ